MRNLQYGLITAITLISIVVGFGLISYPNSSHDTNNGSESSETIYLPQNITLTTFNASEWLSSELSDNIRSGGVAKDGIPPIENPKYVSGLEASTYLSDNDIVFGLDYQGNILAYPQYILVWHEIVNEEFSDVKITLSYCPLTGSAVGFKGHFLTIETTFGVSGKLLNSNLVMYDRDSDSYWPQILGTSIQGDHTNQDLETVQLFWTTWGQWYNLHPDTQVLSEDTGHFRAYGSDPYGSYNSDANNYYNSGGPFFPVMTQSDILADKTIVYGISFNESNLAVEKSILRSNKVINANISNQNIVTFYDDQLGVARVYKSNIGDQIYTFKYENDTIFDVNTGTEWNIEGTSSIGSLEPIVYFDVMWFAWYAFHPDTTLIY
ncbi:MAG: hypothetical protein HeimC3_08310 [Candidatus Heimdallarchaeota archaeon LC_3]|nr:MAG: hypothetical protein HeimC3_08310 [Candidatus Heimdallarchaeota archaeon LC_3]